MLPSDIGPCLQCSDIFPVIQHRGIVDETVGFLTDLLMEDRMWGSIVFGDDKKRPLTFGSCVFLSDGLKSEVLDGTHPFLLAEMVKSHGLRSHILSFKEVERENKYEGLNFYGALFAFPKLNNPLVFGMAMDRLQHDMIFHMRGFRIKTHLKATYETNLITSGMTNFAMRKLFGSNLHTDYRELKGETEVKKFRPHLFAIEREEALTRIHSKVFELVAGGTAILDLPPKIREILRLDLESESYTNSKASQELGKDSVDNGWKSAEEKIKKTSHDIRVSEDDSDEEFRVILRRYVRQNPQELGILTPLTAREKQDWIDFQRSKGAG